ncbi:MAG: ACP S-malonyltransferase [Campylobacterales bacterium]|nr:ACP S-malonyltransferase [Campylobacterales bacterium]
MNKLGFIFPGQGSQKIGMGKDFYENSDVAKEMFEKASRAIDVDFTRLLFEENEDLGKTEYTQPAILLASSIAHRLFDNEMGIKPVFSLGHSLGEFSALVSVGAMTLEDAIFTVHNRGKLMQSACDGIGAGMMVLLGLSDEKVEEMTEAQRGEGKSVWAANYNVDGQIVVAGKRADLESLESIYKEAGAKRAMVLDMSVASHCKLLESAQDPLKKILEEKLNDEFIAPVISNVTANKYSSKAEALDLLSQQLVAPVKYKHSVAAFAGDVDCLIEFGGGVLKGMNKKITDKPTFSVNSMADLEAVYSQIKG